MDNDKIDRTIDIILQNQAQFYADLQALQETQKESEKRVSKLESLMVRLADITLQTNETVEKLAATQRETGDRLQETNERLNAVIYMAEKFFSGNNGDSDKK